MSSNIDNVKNEYISEFVDKTSILFKQGIQSLYDLVLCLNKENKFLLREFQIELEKVPHWNNVMIEKEYQRFLDSSKCQWLGELIMACFKASAQQLMSSLDYPSTESNIDVLVPQAHLFIHLCYIEIARKLWRIPQVLYHKYNKVDSQINHEKLEKIIYESVRIAIRNSLPLDKIVSSFMNKKTVIPENIVKTVMLNTIDKEVNVDVKLLETDNVKVLEDVLETDNVKVLEDVLETDNVKVLEEVLEPIIEPIIEKVNQPIFEKVNQPIFEKVNQPIFEPKFEQVNQPIIEPKFEKVNQPIIEPIFEQPIIEQEIEQPIIEKEIEQEIIEQEIIEKVIEQEIIEKVIEPKFEPIIVEEIEPKFEPIIVEEIEQVIEPIIEEVIEEEIEPIIEEEIEPVIVSVSQKKRNNVPFYDESSSNESSNDSSDNENETSSYGNNKLIKEVHTDDDEISSTYSSIDEFSYDVEEPKSNIKEAINKSIKEVYINEKKKNLDEKETKLFIKR